MTIQRDQAGLEGLLDLEDLIGLALRAGLGTGISLGTLAGLTARGQCKA
jgi:hypothetical protein